MEHYSLQQPSPPFSAPTGMRVLLIQTDEDTAGTGPPQADPVVLPVLAIQPIVVHHFQRDEPAEVFPEPRLMHQHGWRYRHLELRYEPVCITPEGKLAPLPAADPRWRLLPANTTDEYVQQLAEALKVEESIRQRVELGLEGEDETSVRSD